MFSRALALRAEARNKPTVLVTKKEFERQLVAAGHSQLEARKQAAISKILGSAVLGGKMLKIASAQKVAQWKASSTS